MEYTNLGKTNERISTIGFGGWAIGGHGYGKVDDSESIKTINKALDLGINVFDTADVYGFGHSEEILSKALGSRIKDVLVATKFGVRWDDSGRTRKDSSVDSIRKSLEGSLKRLKADCIPLYQLHWHDGVTPLTAIFEEMVRLREEGKIRHVGFSNIPSSVFDPTDGAVIPVSAQLSFSLAFRQLSSDLYAFHEKYGMATFVYNVLERGLLSGKYSRYSIFGERDTRGKDPGIRENFDRITTIGEGVKRVAIKYGKTPSQVAIRWVLENPSVSCALVGVKDDKQIIENAAATGWFMDKVDRDYLSSLGT